MDGVVAEEIAVLPGMEEISALLYINDHVKSGLYDVLILDCAPTAESMRFVSMPTALEWYMKKIFKLERSLAKVAPAHRPAPDRHPPARGRLLRLHRAPDPGPVRREPHTLRPGPHHGASGFVGREDGAARDPARPDVFLPARHVGGGGADQPHLAGGKRARRRRGDPAAAAGVPEDGRALLQPPAPLAGAPAVLRGAGATRACWNWAGPCTGRAIPWPSSTATSPWPSPGKTGTNRCACTCPSPPRTTWRCIPAATKLIIRLGVLRKHVALPTSFARIAPSGARFQGDYLVVSFPSQGERS